MSSVSKTFQELITFRRSSSATYVNSAGYIVNTPVVNYLAYSGQLTNAVWAKSNCFVQRNLILYSQTFSNGLWNKQTGASVTGVKVVAPDGTLTGDQISWAATATGQGILQAAISVSGGFNNTKSIYVRADVAGGTVELADPSSTVGIATLTLTTAWQRVSLTETQTGGTAGVWLRKTASSPANVYVWGAQLVPGSVPGDYQATTAAAQTILYPDYNGVLRANKVGEDATTGGHYINQPITAVPSGVYTFSAYVKAAGTTQAFLYMGGTVGKGIGFDLATGATIQTGDADPEVYSATNVGNGWWKLVITSTSGSMSSAQIYLMSGGSYTYNGNAANGIYIVDAQMNDGPTALGYYDTSATLTYAPRLDFDPVTLAAKGLLVEEQRSNLQIYSEQLNNATGWTPSNITYVPNAVVAPDGAVTADKLVESAGLGEHANLGANISPPAANTVCTVSFYAKAAERYKVGVTYPTTGDAAAAFDLSTGTLLGAVQGSGISAAITPAGNGWYRCSMTFNRPTSANASNNYHVLSNTATSIVTRNYTGDGTSGLYIWGTQLEVGTFASSYIPTVASQVTRAVDLVDLNMLSPWFNQREGTLYISGSYYSAVPATGARGGFAGSGSYAAANSINIFNGGGSTTADVYFTSTTYPDATFNKPLAPAANAINKIGFGYNQNSGNYSLAVNASAVINVTSTQNVATFTALALGRRDATTGNMLNGHLQQFTYYPQRLTNAQLQSITA